MSEVTDIELEWSPLVSVRLAGFMRAASEAVGYAAFTVSQLAHHVSACQVSVVDVLSSLVADGSVHRFEIQDQTYYRWTGASA